MSFIKSNVPGGPAGGDLNGNYPNPKVIAIEETSGPNSLTIGPILDGDLLMRDGDEIVGGTFIGGDEQVKVSASATAAAVGDTALTGSSFKTYDATPTRTGTVVTCITTFGTGDANLNWQELGMDNGTTLLNRIAPIGPFNKTSAVSIVVTVTLTQS